MDEARVLKRCFEFVCLVSLVCFCFCVFVLLSLALFGFFVVFDFVSFLCLLNESVCLLWASARGLQFCFVGHPSMWLFVISEFVWCVGLAKHDTTCKEAHAQCPVL